MCGISGIIKTSGGVVLEDIKRACSVMHHRGPDAVSEWVSEDGKIWFGHLRLSIVDPDPRSNQPFTIDGGDYVMVFNGEIYNYRTLRKKLEEQFKVEFITTSDTEVLIHMYKHYGKDCLEQIEWMFALAIYDQKKDQVFIARDFAGQKPLIYREDATWVYFASELPGLFALTPGFKKKINKEALRFYMIGNFFHLPHHVSFFEWVEKLENAGYMIIEKWKIIEKWRFAKLQKKVIPQMSNEIDFLDEVQDEMRPSDVGYASFLSGWIDSSYICSVLKAHETKQKTDAYTLKISENDADYTRSQYVADQLDLRHHTIELKDFDLLKSVDETVQILGEPYFHITSIYADRILQEAKKNHRVFFTWAAWDECYYGYDNLLFIVMEYYFRVEQFLPKFVKNILDILTCKKYTTILLSDRKNFKKDYYLANYEKVAPLFQDSHSPRKTIEKITADMEDFIEMDDYRDTSYMYGLFLENLHSLTIQWDVIGMKNSIEIRALFLEKRVIERSYSLPFWKKVSLLRLREGKEILRKWLVKIFGYDFVYAKKIGFWVHYDFKGVFENDYQKRIHEKVTKLTERDIFVKEKIEELFTDFRKNFQVIMKLYTIEVCLEYHFDNTNA